MKSRVLSLIFAGSPAQWIPYLVMLSHGCALQWNKLPDQKYELFTIYLFILIYLTSPCSYSSSPSSCYSWSSLTQLYRYPFCCSASREFSYFPLKKLSWLLLTQISSWSKFLSEILLIPYKGNKKQLSGAKHLTSRSY